jgi:hypothetical protein
LKFSEKYKHPNRVPVGNNRVARIDRKPSTPDLSADAPMPGRAKWLNLTFQMELSGQEVQGPEDEPYEVSIKFKPG